MTLTFRCRAETVPKVRQRLGLELRHQGIDQDIIDRLVLATAEACNNAVNHSECASYVVTVDIDEEMCTIAVTDAGGGFKVPEEFEMPEPHEISRRGLALMCALIDDVEVTSNGAGTKVTLRQPLSSRRPLSVSLG
ncbi:MAG TPA: ATP-binding protein [Acidimicrobiales bacterium]